MPRSNNSAFSMIEVVVAIAVMAILAGAMAPLALKALNQQREQKTRDNLKIAFEAMFGSRDHRVANMRADFGFNPNANLGDLRLMTTRTPGTMRDYSPDPLNGGHPWGWNGPYWTGSINSSPGTQGLPLDGWGRNLQLNYAGGANPTWQIQSRGADGVLNSADDLRYPTNPALVANYNSTLTINVIRIDPASTTDPLPVTVTITDLNNGGTHISTPTPPASAFAVPKNLTYHWSYTVNSGAVHIVVSAAGLTNDQIVDLLPGELKTIDFKFN